MKEYTFEEFCQLPMELSLHISGSKEHYLSKRNKEHGIERITVTPVKKNGDFGKPKSVFVFDQQVYETTDQLYVAYMAKACGVTL